MLSKRNIRTSRHGDMQLVNKKTGMYLNFATRKVAERNAKQYTQLLGQNITVFEHKHAHGSSFVLNAETIIL